MKNNYLRLISLIIAALMLAGMLASCKDKGPNLTKMSDPERADMISNLCENDPDDTYITEMVMNISGSLNGVKFEAEYDSRSYSIDIESKSPVIHTEVKVTTNFSAGASSQTQITETTTGFRDGMMYRTEKQDGTSVSLSSKSTFEEYEAHLKSISEHSDEEIREIIKTASAKESVQNEDGSWTATHSGFSEENIKILLDTNFDPAVQMVDGYKVKDIIITTVIADDLTAKEIRYSLVFERTDMDALYAEPAANIVAKLTEVGTATTPEIDLSEYTEVENLGILSKIRKTMSDLRDSENISFKTHNRQNVEFMGNEQSTEETDTIKAETKDGKYSFDIKGVLYPETANEMIVYLVYKDGNYRISGQGVTTQNSKMTDMEAKQMIAAQLDPGSLASALVSEIKTNEAGYDYVFTLANPDYSAFKEAYASLGAKNFKANAEIAVKYADGILSEYQYNFILTATIEGQTLTATISATITVDQ